MAARWQGGARGVEDAGGNSSSPPINDRGRQDRTIFVVASMTMNSVAKQEI